MNAEQAAFITIVRLMNALLCIAESTTALCCMHCLVVILLPWIRYVTIFEKKSGYVLIGNLVRQAGR